MRLQPAFILLLILVFAYPSLGQDSPFHRSNYVPLTRPAAKRQTEQRIKGKVVGVHDGDTCTVLDTNKKQYKIRFDGIDAPELKQPFGNAAKKHLSDLIFGREVMVVSNKTDKYGRTVGKVLLEGKDINYVQILFGYAWHYKKYQDEQIPEDRKNYADAEVKARNLKLGIWSQANILPPWDYRGEKKVSQAAEKAGRRYLIGPKGGCYYVNGSGKKVYVGKEKCDQ
jgi:endonuclease YncB( thermonuclease family)